MKLAFPQEVLRQHLILLGKTGAGKSSALRHITEWLMKHDKRVCIIDPKGDHWGIKWSADGKAEGLPVILFGDFKNPSAQDVPINERSGGHLAELIATGNRPAVIGWRGWRPGQMTQFWIDFAACLFNKNEGELYLIGDEFHHVAPKGKILSPQVGECIHWSNRLLSEGRGLGIVCLLASQRPQKVHNDTLTSCETLVAMRVVHKADRDAVKDWIDGCGDKEKGNLVLNSVAGMERGEAFVWSPEIDFGPERLKFPMFETFDSFAPPQLQKKVSTSTWSNVDLEAVKEKLANVIKEAKANDPKELKMQIAAARKEMGVMKTQLERALRSETNKALPAPEPEKIPIFTKEDEHKVAYALRAVEESRAAVESKLIGVREDLASVLSKIETSLAKKRIVLEPKSKFVRVPNETFYKSKDGLSQVPMRESEFNGALPSGEQKVLTAVAQYPDGVTREQLTILTGFKRSTRDAYVARLREKGYVISQGNGVLATDAGITALGTDFEMLPTGEALIQYWQQKLPIGERSIWTEAMECYPESISREVLGERTGFKRSTRDAYISRLAARKVIEVTGPGEIRASKIFFE